jgi:hypothetical protein
MIVRKPKRFAEGTDVDVGRSRGELEKILRKHGADQILSGSDTREECGFVGFTMTNRQFRMKVSHEEKQGAAKNADLREREAWRLLVLLVKAKLEIVRMGQSTVEQEFLANVVLPNGDTVGEYVGPRIAEAYADGNMPMRLLPP